MWAVGCGWGGVGGGRCVCVWGGGGVGDTERGNKEKDR